jgi:N-acetylglutamate synthase-like GNAT family acetyltransferase
MKFNNTNITLATLTDASAIVQLLNNAYRGEASKKGWTTEAHLISGNQRTNEQQIEELLQQEHCCFLKYVSHDEQVIGCVNLQIKAEGIYLGMFSVHPLQQGAGIGKQFLLAAEEYAKAQGIQRIYMTVIDARTDLIAWYERNGYANTNITIPFEEDAISGKHLQKLSFTVLEKYL